VTARARLDRVGCLIAEAEAERLRKEQDAGTMMSIILEVLEKYPGAKEELMRKMETVHDSPPAWQDYASDPVNLSDDELEQRVRAILERRDRERAAGQIR
jgi:hypothetical protein